MLELSNNQSCAICGAEHSQHLTCITAQLTSKPTDKSSGAAFANCPTRINIGGGITLVFEFF